MSSSSSNSALLAKLMELAKTVSKEDAKFTASSSSAAASSSSAKDDKALCTDDGIAKEDTSWKSKTFTLTRGAARALMLSSGKMRKGKKNKAFSIFEGDVMSGVLTLATTAGGVCQCYTGINTVSNTGGTTVAFFSSPDFGSFAALFDVFQVTGVTVQYEPIGWGQGPLLSSFLPIHGPMIMVADPDSNGGVAFTTLAGQRLISAPNRVFTNTGKAWKKKFSFKTLENVQVNNTTLSVTIGQWLSTLLTASPVVDGGMLTSVLTNTNNNAMAYGYMIWQWHVRWGERL